MHTSPLADNSARDHVNLDKRWIAPMGSAVTASCACGLETTVMIGASLLDQADPAIIVGVVSTSGREIHDQPGHQVLDDGIGGMGFGELL